MVAEPYAAAVRVAKVQRKLGGAFEGDPSSMEGHLPGGSLGGGDREADELLRPGRGLALADLGVLEHQDRAAGVEPHPALAARSHREPEQPDVERLEAIEVTRSQREVMEAHRRERYAGFDIGFRVNSGSMKSVVVATHGHCFDGLASAVLFTRLYEHIEGAGTAAFRYLGAGYGPGQNGVDPAVLDGDVNAILDFRFSRAKNLTWYFDHHVSAFPTPDDREAFSQAATVTPPRMFHDGTYSSCTKLIADVGKARFGFDVEALGLTELVRWADIIDAARFPSAEMAVDRNEPALQLMTVVENHGDASFLTKMVPELLTRPLDEVARGKAVQEAYLPLRAAQQGFVELVKKHARVIGSAVLVDLSHVSIETAAKFVTYALYPTSAYSILLTRSASKCKLSLGYNPWSNVPRTHDIAKICERHGGGGHPVVGAISLPSGDVERAKALAAALAEELSIP